MLNICCRSRNLSGMLAARSLACVQSLLRLYSCQGNPFMTSVGSFPSPNSHGGFFGGADANPAVLIKRARAKHLEVLSYPPARRAGAVLIPGIRHAHAFDRLLRNAVDRPRLRETSSFKDRRHDVDDMMELIADAPGFLDAGRPGHRHAVAGAPKMGGHLLG